MTLIVVKDRTGLLDVTAPVATGVINVANVTGSSSNNNNRTTIAIITEIETHSITVTGVVMVSTVAIGNSMWVSFLISLVYS